MSEIKKRSLGYYRGEAIESLSREQLLDAIEYLQRMYEDKEMYASKMAELAQRKLKRNDGLHNLWGLL